MWITPALTGLTVEDCISLDTAALRKLGLFTIGAARRVSLCLRVDGVVTGNVIVIADLTGDTYPHLRITGTCWDGQQIRQTIRLVEKSMRWGGKRFYMICPPTGSRCCRLILPPGGVSFRSVKGWGLPYRSQHEDAIQRACRAVRDLEERILSLPPRTRRRTRDALQQRLVEREAYWCRIEAHVSGAIASDGRFSVRKAARWANGQ